jgi:hypothetical protein
MMAYQTGGLSGRSGKSGLRTKASSAHDVDKNATDAVEQAPGAHSMDTLWPGAARKPVGPNTLPTPLTYNVKVESPGKRDMPSPSRSMHNLYWLPTASVFAMTEAFQFGGTPVRIANADVFPSSPKLAAARHSIADKKMADTPET